jgi:hypothetical protein
MFYEGRTEVTGKKFARATCLPLGKTCIDGSGEQLALIAERQDAFQSDLQR